MTLEHLQDTGPLRIGDTFLDRYQILGIMGRGGFGFVYRARSQFMGREVAIKVMARQNKLTDEMRARGQREAIILGQLEHPNIVRVYEAEVSPSGHLYIVMELLEGTTIGQRIHERGPLGVREGLLVLEKLCLALETAHRIKAVHRDLKPANIFLCKDGSPRILDFGIAKLAGSAGWQTAPNMVVGTSLYISPEQIRGRPASHLSDIYALGLVAFQMFHGTHPLILQEPNVNLKEPQAVWQLHIKTRPPLLSQVIEGFPPHVARLVNTAIAKDPGQRFQSAGEMAEKIRIALLKLDAERGPSVVPSFASDDTVATERPPEEGAAQKRDSQTSAPGTERLDKRKTRKLFDVESRVERESPPESDPIPSLSPPTREERPSSTPASSHPMAKRQFSFAPPAPQKDMVPHPNGRAQSVEETAEHTTGAAQNVSRTLSLPGLKSASRPKWIGAAAVVLGALVGGGIIAVTQPFADGAEQSTDGEIVIEEAKSASSSVKPTEAAPQKADPVQLAPDPVAPLPVKAVATSPTAAKQTASPASVPQPSAPPSPKPAAPPKQTTQAAPAPEKTALPLPKPAPATKSAAPTVPDSGLWD